MLPQRLNKKNNMTIVFNSDDGVDDALAQLLILAQHKITDTIHIPGMVASVGNAILGQTEDNVRRILELVGEKTIPVYPGALTPLGLEKNVSKIDAAINATHFYGHDGLSDLPPQSWPVITIPLQKKKGYEFIAELVINASPENPITLVSTASLTEIYKALCRMEEICKELMLPPGCYANNLIIVAMGGIIDLNNGPNAPFDRPDYNNKTCTPNNPPCKDAEANFYWDTPATQGVFAMSTKYGIKIQLITLDLTQQPRLLWTKKQVAELHAIPNPVASQIANMTDAVPWLDAKHFPKGTYPWHDGLTSAWILWGETLFTKKPVSIQIGDHGQTLLNTSPHAKPNVDLIGIRPEKAALCMQKVVGLFNNFNQSLVTKIKPLFLLHHTIFSEFNNIEKISEKEISQLFLSDHLSESSNSPSLDIPIIWRATSKLSNEINRQKNRLINHINGFFSHHSERKQIPTILSNLTTTEQIRTSGTVNLSTKEFPCYYPDGTTNILDQFGEQPTNALIGSCKLNALKISEQIDKDTLTSSGFMTGFQSGFTHGTATRFFHSQGRSEFETTMAVEGMMAASIAAVSIPAAMIYIILNSIPNRVFQSREKELIGGFIFLATLFSNSENVFSQTLLSLIGYQLANDLVDTVANLLQPSNKFRNNLGF